MRSRLLTLHAVIALIALSSSLLAQRPTIESTNLLSRIIWYPSSDDRQTGGGFHIDGMWGAFLPDDVLYDGSNDHDRLLMHLLDGDGNELWRTRLIAEQRFAVFSWVRPVGKVPQYWFTETGAYTLVASLDGKPMVRLPFHATMERGGDPFDPKLTTRFDGPWSELGVWHLPHLGDPGKQPKFQLWVLGGTHNRSGGADKVQFSVRHEGDEIYTARPATVPSLATHSAWRPMDFQPRFPEAEGGGLVSTADLLKRDGLYHVVMEREGEVTAAWPYEVRNGAIVPHARQALDFEPAHDALLMRLPDGSVATSTDLFWADRLNGEAARAAVASTRALVTGPGADERARWTVTADGPAAAPTVGVSAVRARMDGGLAAGRDVIAFGTGGFKGVGWMKPGDDLARSLPGGSDYLASTVFVCDRIIVAVKDRQVVLFDTETEQLHEVPTDVVSLAAMPRGRYEASPIHADGRLVVVACDPTKVQDRTVIKVLDLSVGVVPRVIALDNADFSGSEVTSVAVDAEDGQVAVSVNKRKALYVGAVADGAALRGYDVSGHDGVGRYGLALDRGQLAWRDEPSTGQIRVLDTASGGVQSLGSIDGPGTRFALRDGLAAWPWTESNGGDRLYALARPFEARVQPAAAGEGFQGVQGKLGFGQSVALVPGGGVFVAGAGKSGIGSGELLMATTGTRWQAVGATAEGKPLPAVDVTPGVGLVAFKTGSRNETVIGWARFGSGLVLE